MYDMDKDGSGKVDFDEFLQWFDRYNSEKEKRMWKKSPVGFVARGKPSESWKRNYRLKRARRAKELAMSYPSVNSFSPRLNTTVQRANSNASHMDLTGTYMPPGVAGMHSLLGGVSAKHHISTVSTWWCNHVY
jgi:hypothetical protein